MRWLLIATLFLTGCASQIMDSYVGKDVTEAILDYGPPVNQLDLPDGSRAFQWKMSGGGTFIGTTGGGITTGSLFSSDCVYTLFGRKNPAGSFTVTGYRKPTLDCE